MPKEDIRFHYRWWEPPCGCWELIAGPLEEHPALLTTEPCPSPQDKVTKASPNII